MKIKKELVDEEGNSPLHAACEAGKLQFVDLILNSSDQDEFLLLK